MFCCVYLILCSDINKFHILDNFNQLYISIIIFALVFIILIFVYWCYLTFSPWLYLILINYIHNIIYFSSCKRLIPIKITAIIKATQANVQGEKFVPTTAPVSVAPIEKNNIVPKVNTIAKIRKSIGSFLSFIFIFILFILSGLFLFDITYLL